MCSTFGEHLLAATPQHEPGMRACVAINLPIVSATGR
jgi:hypothetical protein